MYQGLINYRKFQEDLRVEMLNLWAQSFLKLMGLKNSRIGLFSSYHIAMIVIYFLQVC